MKQEIVVTARTKGRAVALPSTVGKAWLILRKVVGDVCARSNKNESRHVLEPGACRRSALTR